MMAEVEKFEGERERLRSEVQTGTGKDYIYGRVRVSSVEVSNIWQVHSATMSPIGTGETSPQVLIIGVLTARNFYSGPRTKNTSMHCILLHGSTRPTNLLA